MIQIGDKQFRNLQEQVEKNKNDIEYILQEEGVLNEFGIRVTEQVDDIADLPSVADYKESHTGWEYGDCIAVGTEEPYELYILTRANGSHPNDYWFDLGVFPLPGPQGPQGIQGIQGEQGIQGVQGPQGVRGYTGPRGYSMISINNAIDTEIGFVESIPYYDGAQVGDLVLSRNAESLGYYGKVTIIGTSNAYCMVQTLGSLRGPQGQAGTQVVANPTLAGTENALSSIQIGNNKYKIGGKTTNIYLSSVAGTYDSSTYSFSIPITSLIKLNGTSFSVDDFDENADNLIYYIDMSSMNPQDVKLKAIYSFRGIDTTTSPNNALCNIEMLAGGGKQLYQHNIELKYKSEYAANYNITLSIINDSNVAFTYDTLLQYLRDKGFKYDSGYQNNGKGYPCCAIYSPYDNGYNTRIPMNKIMARNDSNTYGSITGVVHNASVDSMEFNFTSPSYYDTIVPL